MSDYNKQLGKFLNSYDDDSVNNSVADNWENSNIEFETEEELFKNISEDMDSNEGRELIGLSTGFKGLDNYTEGYQGSQLWVIGGSSSSGKSQLVLQLASKLVDTGNKAVVFSLEMPKYFNYYRMAGSKFKRKINDFRKGKIEKTERERMMKTLINKNMIIYARESQKYEDMLKLIRKEAADGAKVFFIDYLQQISHTDDITSHKVVSKVISEIYGLALELKVTVVLLSQVTKAKTNEKAYGALETADFKGSGDIENVASVALFISQEMTSQQRAEKREYAYKTNGITEFALKLKITKNRDGNGTGFINVKSQPEFGIFEEIDDVEFDQLLNGSLNGNTFENSFDDDGE